MLISHSLDFTFKGKTALMHVLRNDGYCWGRIVPADGSTQLDVSVDADLYDETDADALNAFIEAVNNATATIEPAVREI